MRSVPLPAVVGSLAMAAAASGALAMPQAGASPFGTSGSLASSASPDRPVSGQQSALDPLETAQQLLATEHASVAKVAFVAAVDLQRREAADKADREQRAAQEEARNAHRWVSPTTNYRITAGYGASSRLWSNRHTGLDFAAPSGTPVFSVSSGEIISAGYEGAYGNRIVVRHWDGTETWYCHLSRFVKRSGEVQPGELIGRVGSSGNATGPHLHLEVHPGGDGPVNPRTWLASVGVKV